MMLSLIVTRYETPHNDFQTQRRKNVENRTEINAAVKVVMESGGITNWSDQDPSGVFTIHARVMVDFNGPDLQAIFNRLSVLDPDQVEAVTASAVTSSLVALLGPDIVEGGIHVQD